MPKKTSKVTLASISEKLAISQTTVSRALNGKARQYRISEETVNRIQALAAKLEFSPNHFARSLRTRKTSTIGVIVPDISNSFFASITQAITATAHRSGFSTLLCDSQNSVALEAESIKVIENRSADGLLICPVGTESAHVADYAKRNSAVVVVDRNLVDVQVPFVGSDNFSGAKDATEYLIQHGHQRILCLNGVPGTTPTSERFEGFKAAHQKYGLEYDNRLVVGDSFGEMSGYMETKMQLSLNREFTAIFAMSNMTALGAIRALTEAGLRIPDDVSIISFDDSPFAPYLSTPLSSILQQNAEIANIAVRLLLQRIGDESVAEDVKILLPTTFVNRKSVRTLTSSSNV